MNRRKFSASLASLLVSAALGTPAWAQDVTPAHGAIGAWSGGVSWNERTLYSWEIYPDGTFSSGRYGRGHDGGGFWLVDGAELTLKYESGFRYEGEFSGDSYAGTAYGADGRAQGEFSMSRIVKRVGDDPPAEDY